MSGAGVQRLNLSSQIQPQIPFAFASMWTVVKLQFPFLVHAVMQCTVLLGHTVDNTLVNSTCMLFTYFCFAVVLALVAIARLLRAAVPEPRSVQYQSRT